MSQTLLDKDFANIFGWISVIVHFLEEHTSLPVMVAISHQVKNNMILISSTHTYLFTLGIAKT